MKVAKIKKFIEDVNNIFNLLQARINYFIKNYIDTVVIRLVK